MSSGRKRLSQLSFEPIDWSAYFDRRSMAELPSGKFCYYTLGDESEGPMLLLLHGGGFSALSWALLSKELTTRIRCACVAVDIRGHGDTQAKDETDFCLDKMAEDAAALIGQLTANQERPIVAVGHSMGGAVATHIAYRQLLPLSALIVIDVVEGSAVEALTGMQSLLSSRPRRFPSLPAAIEWCFKSGTVRNIESARVSFRGHLRPEAEAGEKRPEAPRQRLRPKVQAISEEEEEGEEEEAPDKHQHQHQQVSPLPPLPVAGPRLLAQNRRQQKPPLPASVAMATPASTPPGDGGGYTWRIDLMSTQPYWLGWFSGMSSKFLSCQPAKLLLLAGVDRLDKELTVGQMQGKFQLQVLPRSGHAVHEDHPEHVAEVLASFLVRHRLAAGGDNFRPVPPGC